jgi:hypothetical protein
MPLILPYFEEPHVALGLSHPLAPALLPDHKEFKTLLLERRRLEA